MLQQRASSSVISDGPDAHAYAQLVDLANSGRLGTLRAMTDALGAGLILQTRDGTIVEANDAASRILRADPGGLAGRTPLDGDWPEVQLALWAADQETPSVMTRRTGLPSGCRIGLARADGTVLWADVGAIPLPEGSTGDAAVATILIDVTAAVLADEHRAAVEKVAHVATWSWSLGGEKVDWSRELTRMFALPDDELGSDLSTLASLVVPDDIERVRAVLGAAVRSAEPFELEFRAVRTDGVVVTVVTRGEPIHARDGQPFGYTGTIADVSEARAREARLRGREEQLRVLIDTMPDIIARLDRDFTHVQLNQACADLAGKPLDELVGKGLDGLGAPRWLQALWHRELRAVVESREPRTFDWTIPRPGDERWLESHAAPELDENGEVTHIVVVSRDVTERRRVGEALAYQATHDGLTGLPNRRVLLDVLDDAADTDEGVERFAVLLLDVDRFKLVNDTLGHPTGDAVLIAVAQRLRAAVREGDFISRLGGDEFVVVASDVDEDDEARRIAERILAALREPMTVEGQEFRPSVSIGIARPDHEGATATELLSRADAAMYLAKERGRDRVEFFDRELQRSVEERLAIDAALRHGIERDELRIHYQPEVDLVSGRILAYEALVRWERPDGQMIPASEFVPVAEESELIVELGHRVLELVSRDVGAWHRDGNPAPAVRMNLSARELADPALVERVRCALEASAVPKGTLWFELTETTLMSDTPTVQANLLGLSALDIPIAIDDFGSGYSSLAYLKRLPVAAIKIDRGFVEHLPTSNEDAAIVEAVVSLGRALGVAVIAEGVETEAHRDALLALGCLRAQGFLFGAAVPAEEITGPLRAAG